jgi:hypothetical protein
MTGIYKIVLLAQYLSAVVGFFDFFQNVFTLPSAETIMPI